MSLRPGMRPLAVAAVVLLAAAGCGGGGDDDASSDFEPGGSTVVDTGDAPLADRVWNWDPAATSTVTLTTAVTQSIRVGDTPETSAPLPTSVVTLELRPRAVDGDGIELLVTAVEVVATTEGFEIDDEGLAEALGDQEDAFGALVGAAAVVGVTPRGAITSYTPADPDVELPVETLLERTITELERLMVQWPDEPVGVGAGWETTAVRISQGITWEVTTQWRLESTDGDLRTVSFTLDERAQRQEVPAAEGRDISGSVTGNGVVVVDPVAARIVSAELTTELSATVFEGDDVAATTSNRIGTIASSSVD